MVRLTKIVFLLALIGLVTFSACEKDDDKKDDEDEKLSIEASFVSEYTSNYEYIFKVTTEKFDSAVWFIENKTLRGGEITYTFEKSGEYDVKLRLYASNNQGDIIFDEYTKRIYVNAQFQIAEISTSYGKFLIYLYQSTPLHRENFIKLATEKFYNGTTFHRVIRNFVIQGGDPLSKDANPNNDGTGGPGYTIPAEINGNLRHVYGAVAAARLPNDVNPNRESSGSQFYVVENKSGTPHLNNEYTIFGIVFSGMDVVSNIAKVAVEPNSNRPIDNIPMEVNIIAISEQDLATEYNFNIPAE